MSSNAITDAISPCAATIGNTIRSLTIPASICAVPRISIIPAIITAIPAGVHAIPAGIHTVPRITAIPTIISSIPCITFERNNKKEENKIIHTN